MTTPPPFPPPPLPPPGAFPPRGSGDEGGRFWRLMRNVLIGVICLITVIALAVTCGVDGIGSRSARNYIETTYVRNAALDEGAVRAYVADGQARTVANEIAKEQRPTDLRSGASQVGNVAGSVFLQYPDYLVGVFPYGADKSKVMLTKDYRSGYNHYHNYVGGFWVPTPRYSGRGNTYRGGGSGSGK